MCWKLYHYKYTKQNLPNTAKQSLPNTAKVCFISDVQKLNQISYDHETMNELLTTHIIN